MRLSSIKGNTQNMDLVGNLEIYIPVEAEVKNIPLWSLPKSVLRRMDLPLSDQEGSRKLTDSPEGIWICPAVIRKKGQKLASHTENMSSLLGREFQAVPGPFQMSFVSSNRTAYKVLKETMPGKSVSTHTSHGSLLPQGSAPQKYKAAVVIYHGRIYLSSKKRKRSRRQRETGEPQIESSRSQTKCRSPQVCLEPADKKLRRKKLRATLPRTSPQQLKDRLTKTDHPSTTDQELLNDNRPKEKHTTMKVTHSENKKDVMIKRGDVSSSTTGHSVPQSTDRVLKAYSRPHRDTDAKQAAEEAGGSEPAWCQPQGKQQQQEEEVANNDGGECDNQDMGNEEADYIQMDSGEPDNIVGFVEQSSNCSWTRREPEGVASSSSTSLQEFDFKALAEEEKIAQMKAKLRRSEAALNNLHAS
ncbi:uncharacterized protein LOC141772292 [Sebastes fasciatus]|uniref:uncharacterized protein LOC141772292 n=1 Tax=Sebastes fasciatus TaxID=394691 RepID=UPI003D9ECC7F